jgi:2-hydroxychromene-2-carboxylate isomerase
VQNQGQKDLVSVYERAVAQGVSYAPTMFLGDEPFQGRAQLPLLMARLRAGI